MYIWMLKQGLEETLSIWPGSSNQLKSLRRGKRAPRDIELMLRLRAQPVCPYAGMKCVPHTPVDSHVEDYTMGEVMPPGSAWFMSGCVSYLILSQRRQ
jgi:hypothetical protein